MKHRILFLAMGLAFGFTETRVASAQTQPAEVQQKQEITTEQYAESHTRVLDQAVQLNELQKKQATQIYTALHKRLHSSQTKHDGSKEGIAAARKQIKDYYNAKIRNILNDTQKVQYDQVIAARKD